MAKIRPVSGFPEWLPAQRLAELKILDQLRSAFETYGFAPIETRSIEPLSVLLKKGDDKEIYVLKRLHEPDQDGAQDGAESRNEKNRKNSEEGLGLHFDLTVPFARYVQEFQNELAFPFKRYQIQKVWRGERKQEGRYREFYQCDIDVIGVGQLPLYYDAEFARLLLEVMLKLPIPSICLKINNRKVLQGFYQGLGIQDPSAALRILDKLAKIGEQAVLQQLTDELSLPSATAEQCLRLAKIRGRDLSTLELVRDLGIQNPILEEGLSELEYVMNFNAEFMSSEDSYIEVDFSIARGLDYYTGTVYEGYMLGHEHIGAVCSGGRYDNLCDGGKQKMPGLGVSIGITRVLGYLFGHDLLEVKSASPVKVLVILNDEDGRLAAFNVAQKLRGRGIATDVYHMPQQFGKQMKAAEKRGIPYVCFIMDGSYQIKELATGMQSEVDLEIWQPKAEYLGISILRRF